MSVAEKLNTWDGNEKRLYEEVLLGLFIRLARCKLHHPVDLPAYLNAWNKWKEIVIRNSSNKLDVKSSI
jgi:hypothetical protein